MALGGFDINLQQGYQLDPNSPLQQIIGKHTGGRTRWGAVPNTTLISGGAGAATDSQDRHGSEVRQLASNNQSHPKGDFDRYGSDVPYGQWASGGGLVYKDDGSRRGVAYDQNAPGQAMSATPWPDSDYVNVSLQIDPNWAPLNSGSISSSLQASFKQPGTGGNSPSPAYMIFTYVENLDDGLTEGVTANYATSDVVGRDEQYETYTGTTNRQISVTFILMAQGLTQRAKSSGFVVQNQNDQLPGYVAPPANTSPPSALSISAPVGSGMSSDDKICLNEVVYPARWIESLQHSIPDASTGLSYAPPPLILVVGNLLVARVVMTQCSIRWTGPWLPGSMLPQRAIVTCEFAAVRNALANEPQYSSDSSLGALSNATPSYNLFVTFPTQGPGDTQGTGFNGTPAQPKT